MTCVARNYAVAPRPNWTQLWSEKADCISSAVHAAANKYQIDTADLQYRVLLHLPRFSAGELIEDTISRESERLAARIAEYQDSYHDWLEKRRIATLLRSEVRIREIPTDVAQIIHQRFHYIGTFRAGVHFGAYYEADTIPFALATASMMDVEILKSKLRSDEIERSMFVARVFAFRWAPPNSISYLLGAVRRTLGERDGIANLFSWVNPNLGFRGASYRASNWHLYATFPLEYKYVDGDYITERQLREMGILELIRVRPSQLQLLPLELWYCSYT
jgi:hypothetical protein